MSLVVFLSQFLRSIFSLFFHLLEMPQNLRRDAGSHQGTKQTILASIPFNIITAADHRTQPEGNIALQEKNHGKGSSGKGVKPKHERGPHRKPEAPHGEEHGEALAEARAKTQGLDDLELRDTGAEASHKACF